MATQTIKTRIVIKNDTAENWGKSTLVLLKCEMAVESDTGKFKFGDGVHTFSELNYTYLTLDEVHKLVSDSALQSISIASGTNNGTIKLTVDGQVTDNIAVKGLGTAAYQPTSAFATAGHSHSAASATANGFMSKEDKAKLNAIESGAQVNTITGVKGNSESAYRTGNINLTKANIGLGNVDNTADSTKNVASAAKITTAKTITFTGGVTGTASTDWSNNVSIATTVANDSHKHGNSTITGIDAGKITTGTISIDRLPAGALERCVVVADDTARKALTTKDVQKGDTVKVTSTGLMYFVVDDTKLSADDGYIVYTAGSASSVPWSGVTGKPASFTPSTHDHSLATTSANGFMSASDKTKLNGIAAGAEVNQNAFGNVIVGSTTIASGAKTANLTFTAGSNVTLTPDAANKKITIAAADTGITAVTANNGLTRTISGRTLTLGISSVSTDLLIQGSDTLIFDCGTSAT